MRPLITALTALAFVVGCATTPTGRKQLMLLPADQAAHMGEQAFQQIKQQQPIEQSDPVNRYVQCISDQLLQVAQTDFEDWEVVVFESEEPTPSRFRAARSAYTPAWWS